MASIRTRGALKFAAGAIATIAIAAGVLWMKQSGDMQPNIFAMAVIAIPGAWGLGGLLEAVSGVPFAQIAGRWDQLAGWQRGVLGLLVVIIAFVVLLFGIIGYAYLTN